MPIVHSHASISGHYTNSGCCSLLLLSTKYHVCLLLRQTRTHLYVHTHRHTHTHTEAESKVKIISARKFSKK